MPSKTDLCYRYRPSVTKSTLHDTAKLLDWFADHYPNRQSEHKRIMLLAAARYAIRKGRTNPAGLFAKIIREDDFRGLTEADIDAGAAAWKGHRTTPHHPSVRPYVFQIAERRPPGTKGTVTFAAE